VQIHQNDVVTGEAVNEAVQESQRAASDTVSATVTALADGVWQLQYTLTKVSDLWTLSILVQPNGAGPAYHVQGSPFTIICQENVTAPANTVISGAGATAAIAGDTTDFTVTLFDSGNNQRTSGGDQVAVTITSAAGGAASTAQGIEVFDLEDGTYTIRYNVLGTSTLHLITVTVNGDAGNQKTSTLTVSSNTTSPEASTFASTDLAWPTTAAATIVRVTDTYTFTTSLKDAYSNPIQERVEQLVTEVEGQGQVLYITASLVDLATGLYTSSFTIPTTTNRSISLCGQYTVHQYLIAPGGLTASYYANKWFSPYSKPYLQQIDPVINFNWTTDEDIIPNVAREYVSIEWVGYLSAPSSGDYYFETVADDGVRLWVHDQLLVDSLADVTDDLPRRNSTLTPLALVAGQFVPIRVRYYQAAGAAGVRLSWLLSGSGGNFTTIESQYLYHKLNNTAITARTEILTAEYLPQMPTGLT
jgi:hypothetical protein